MNKIKVHCRTNLDRYQRYAWPTIMAGVPHKGDHVECAEGHRLTVVGVLHEHCQYDDQPTLQVELHYDQNQMELDKLRGWWP